MGDSPIPQRSSIASATEPWPNYPPVSFVTGKEVVHSVTTGPSHRSIRLTSGSWSHLQKVTKTSQSTCRKAQIDGCTHTYVYLKPVTWANWWKKIHHFNQCSCFYAETNLGNICCLVYSLVIALLVLFLDHQKSLQDSSVQNCKDVFTCHNIT